MTPPGPHVAVSAVLAATAVAGLSLANVAETLGAHPWWSQRVGLMGIVPGLVFWLALRWGGAGPRQVAVLALVLLVAAGALTGWGKARFVASFAEDVLAGRVWYLGWIVVTASLTALLAGCITLVLQPRVRGLSKGGRSGAESTATIER